MISKVVEIRVVQEIEVLMDKTHPIAQILAKADIEINGSRPWDMQIIEPRVFSWILREPSLGSGESYMEGWWSCQLLDDFFFRLMRNIKIEDLYKNSRFLFSFFKNFFLNPQSYQKSQCVAEQHYNLGNNLFRAMLGETMAYTCGYWKNVHTLDQAQFAKYELVCQKLQFQPGENILELGCGFGGFAKYAAEKYGVNIVSVNISSEQVRYAREICKGLSVKIVESDYP